MVEPPNDAEKTLDAAIAKLAALTSVSADITETVDMLEQQFTIRGRYRKTPNRRISLQLKVSGLADATASMIQVCDGQTLWDYQQVLESKSCSRIDINPVLEKLKAPEIDELTLHYHHEPVGIRRSRGASPRPSQGCEV